MHVIHIHWFLTTFNFLNNWQEGDKILSFSRFFFITLLITQITLLDIYKLQDIDTGYRIQDIYKLQDIDTGYRIQDTGYLQITNYILDINISFSIIGSRKVHQFHFTRMQTCQKYWIKTVAWKLKFCMCMCLQNKTWRLQKSMTIIGTWLKIFKFSTVFPHHLSFSSIN